MRRKEEDRLGREETFGRNVSRQCGTGGAEGHNMNEISFPGSSVGGELHNGGLQAMIRKKMNPLLWRLKYLRLLVEINILTSLSGIRRD